MEAFLTVTWWLGNKLIQNWWEMCPFLYRSRNTEISPILWWLGRRGWPACQSSYQARHPMCDYVGLGGLAVVHRALVMVLVPAVREEGCIDFLRDIGGGAAF